MSRRDRVGAVRTISGDLIEQVRFLYRSTLSDFASGKYPRTGIQGHSDHAFLGYIAAAAAIEAFVNESFLSGPSRAHTPDSPLWSIGDEWIERLPLLDKLIVLPHILYGHKLDRSAQPHQDMAILVKARNAIVHFKMQTGAPAWLTDLDQRGVSLIAPNADEHGADYDWPSKLASSEGLRWANNTAYAVAHALAQLTSRNYQKHVMGMAANFAEISEEMASEHLSSIS